MNEIVSLKKVLSTAIQTTYKVIFENDDIDDILKWKQCFGKKGILHVAGTIKFLLCLCT